MLGVEAGSYDVMLGFVELLLRTALARHQSARIARTVRVAYDPMHGYGLQAARDIATGELVIKYE